MKINSLPNIVLASAAFLLVGCNSSETTVVEKEPTVIEDDHAHNDELGKGRLAIAESEQAILHIFDLEDNTLVDSITLTHPAEYLYASPENRYAVAVQRTLNSVEFVDGGLWQELHGDHYDQHNDAPMLTSFQLHDVKPTHYVPRGDKAAIFFDGNEETAESANLVLLSDESIALEKLIAEYHFDTYMHGTAEIRGDFVLTTLRDSDTETTLPAQVALLEVHDEHFHQEQVFETTCPALHGSFQTDQHIAFACEDGVLAIEQQGSVFTAHKIANPTDLPEGVRIGSLKGSEENEVMIGISRAGYHLVDLTEKSITAFNWQAEDDLTSVSYGFDGHNEHMIILDNTGQLNLFSAENNWQLEKRIPLFDALAEDAKPFIIASKAHELIYVINGQEVTTVDLHDGEVINHFDLDFVPGKAAWLGVANEEEHQH